MFPAFKPVVNEDLMSDIAFCWGIIIRRTSGEILIIVGIIISSGRPYRLICATSLIRPVRLAVSLEL